MKSIAPKWFRNIIVRWAKAYHPRYAGASVDTLGGWGVDSGQELEANVKAVKHVLWAYVCIARIVRSVAGLPMKFYRGYGDEKEEINKGAIYDIMHRPNPEDTHRELWMDTAGFMLGTGTAYWALDQIGGLTGRLIEGRSTLWTLPAHRVKVVPAKGDPEKRIARYEIMGDSGESVIYQPEEIVQFKSFNLESQYYGLAPLTVAMQLMETDYEARKHNRNFFRHGASPGVHLKTEQRYDETTEKRIVANFRKNQQGSDNAHKLFISWAGLDLVDQKKSPKDLDFINLIKLNREEIIALFGVPPAVVGLFEYANYANAEMQKKEFWLETIIPMLAHFESRLNEMVFPRWSPDEQIWMEFDLSKVQALKEDLLMLARVSAICHNSGYMTANEVRNRFWNMEPVEGGDELKKPANPFTAPPEKRLSIKGYDDTTQTWWRKDLNRRKHEGRFFDEMKGYFVGQKNRLLKVLSGYASDYDYDASDLDNIFNDLAEQNILEKQTHKRFEDAVEDAGQTALDEVKPKKSFKQEDAIDVVGAFDITDPEVTKWIENKVARFVTYVTDSTKRKIRDLIATGYEEGWSIRQLSNELGGMFDDFSKARSLMIAQTEMGASTNAGTIQGYRQSGVVDKKVWLSARDSKVRDSHAMAEAGGAIGLMERFSNGLDHPGDPSGLPEETINCRCAMAGVVAEE